MAQDTTVLVVEDEVAIALDLEAELREAGCEVIGPGLSPEEAFAQAAETPVDGAIVNASALEAVPPATVQPLVDAGVPIILATGHGTPSIPANFSAAVIVKKPYRLSTLVRMLLGLIHIWRSKLRTVTSDPRPGAV